MIKTIFEKLHLAKKILIITHPNPDGDTLGTACALKLFLGQKADVLLQLSGGRKYPEMYSFLPHIDEAKDLENVQKIYDTVVCVDVASFDRIVEEARNIFEGAETTINIDHHKTNRGFAQYNYVLGDLSSAGEVLFEMFQTQNIKITSDIANCLYTAILTDTGCFKYENVTKKTLEAAATLAGFGAETSAIARKCYDLKPKSMVMFQAYCTANAKFLNNDKIAYTLIRKKDLENFGAKDEHTEGIVEVLRSIKSVEFALVLKEVNSKVTKVSLRSKEKDVTLVVKKFGGGGHSRAAGCTIRKPLDEALFDLLDEVKKFI